MVQLAWLIAISRRNCLSHWFFYSKRPLVWGSYTVDKFQVIPNSLVRAFLKYDVKHGSLSVIK
jgi:hypothetical protein